MNKTPTVQLNVQLVFFVQKNLPEDNDRAGKVLCSQVV